MPGNEPLNQPVNDEQIRQWWLGNQQQVNYNIQYQAVVTPNFAPQQPEPPVEEAETILDEDGVKVANEFLVGCDPEFVVLDNAGQVINGNYILSSTGQVGWDHGGRVIELRPGPSKCTYTILKRLQKLIGDEKLKRFPVPNKFRAGGLVHTRERNESLGGHVHIDLDPGPRLGQLGVVECSLEQQQRLAALDHVTKRLEDLDILPGNESTERRHGEYGKWGDFRINSDGQYSFVDRQEADGRITRVLNLGKRRFEYRTMASWLYDPKTAYICLTAAKLASLDPSNVIPTLLKKTQYPFRRLQDWFHGFAGKDDDAARICERLLSKGIRALKADPEADFREKWAVLPA